MGTPVVFPGGSDGKVSVYSARDPVQSLGWEDPLEKEMAIHSSILPGKSHGQRSLEGYSPWSRKELDTTELDITSLCHKYVLVSSDCHKKFPQLSFKKYRNVFSHSSGGQKFKRKVSARPCFR